MRATGKLQKPDAGCGTHTLRKPKARAPEKRSGTPWTRPQSSNKKTSFILDCSRTARLNSKARPSRRTQQSREQTLWHIKMHYSSRRCVRLGVVMHNLSLEVQHTASVGMAEGRKRNEPSSCPPWICCEQKRVHAYFLMQSVPRLVTLKLGQTTKWVPTTFPSIGNATATGRRVIRFSLLTGSVGIYCFFFAQTWVPISSKLFDPVWKVNCGRSHRKRW